MVWTSFGSTILKTIKVLPYTQKFLWYEIFAVHQANRIFVIIFSRTTYYNFSRFSRKLLRCLRFVAYTCFHMVAKIYLTTFSVSKIDWVCLIACHRHVAIDWNYRVLSKVMAPRVKVNTSRIIRLLPKIEQSSANKLQRMVLQLQFVISNKINGSQA